jgi:hypothetical protein
MISNPKISDSAKRVIEAIIRLRLAVCYLGEKRQKAWWGTDLLSDTGLRFLENIFSRTARNAAFVSACEAARLVHDKSIGRSGCFHLFRLPPDVESLLEAARGDFDLGEVWPTIRSEAEALATLDKLAESRIQAPVGPVQIGTAGRILRKDSVNEIAAHYASAFKGADKCFPYFAKD